MTVIQASDGSATLEQSGWREVGGFDRRLGVRLWKTHDGLNVEGEREREALSTLPGFWLSLYCNCMRPVIDSLNELMWAWAL